MVQALSLNEIFDAPLSLKNVLEPYHLYSVHTRSEWQQFFRSEASEKLKEAFRNVILSLDYDGREVYDWNLFAEKFYRASGTPWFSGFKCLVLELPEEVPVPDSKLRIPFETNSFFYYTSRISWKAE